MIIQRQRMGGLVQTLGSVCHSSPSMTKPIPTVSLFVNLKTNPILLAKVMGCMIHHLQKKNHGYKTNYLYKDKAFRRNSTTNIGCFKHLANTNSQPEILRGTWETSWFLNDFSCILCANWNRKFNINIEKLAQLFSTFTHLPKINPNFWSLRNKTTYNLRS